MRRFIALPILLSGLAIPTPAAAAPAVVRGDWRVEATVVQVLGAARPARGTEVRRTYVASSCAAPCRVRLRERLPGGGTARVRYVRRPTGLHRGSATTRLRCAGGQLVPAVVSERFRITRAPQRGDVRLAAQMAGRARITGMCGGAPATVVADWTAERTDLPEPPTPGFTTAPDPVSLTLDGGVATFTDTSLDDLDGGEVVGWTWDFGDGSGGTGRTVGHRYAALGTFTVRLTVTDDDGLTASVSDVVTVEP